MGDTEANELKLYIDNDGDLYRQQTTSILRNLATKKARGVYDHALAAKLFGYLVESGAKKYTKEFGGTWHQVFDVPTRKKVAAELADDFENEWRAGSYRDLLPKKYQEGGESKLKKKANSTAFQVRRDCDEIMRRAK